MSNNNNHNNNNNTIFILYKIVNSESDKKDPCFNAFPYSFNNNNGGQRGPTLASVKQQCAAAYGLNHLGPEGYHWRVFVEDKSPVPGEQQQPTTAAAQHHRPAFSWWDIQDENATLPVKEAKQSQLSKFFGPESVHYGNNNESIDDNSDEFSAAAATKAAKGAFKTLGKAIIGGGSSSSDGVDSGPSVRVVAFKLLDLVKMHDEFKGGTTAMPVGQQQQQQQQQQRRHHHRQQSSASSASSSQQQQRRQPPQQQHGYVAPRPVAPAPATAPSRHPPGPHQQQQQQQQRTAAPQRAAPPPPPREEASLMDFGPTPSRSAGSNGGMPHSSSTPSVSSIISGSGSSGIKPPPPPNETRAQKLKREYAEKNSTANRVWDEIDERWVEVDKAAATTPAPQSLNNTSRGLSGLSSISGGSGASFDEGKKKKEVGIKLDPANARGKSAAVQAAVQTRVNEMKQAQAKALQEVREREQKKKMDEAEEDMIRKQLEPKIKVWSEEHGKKKQLRALLASLHTILWNGSGWKQVTIGDLLDSKKVKVQFHKASRVVHPDKTHHLPAEQRFLAKRIFDALSQAKNEFDEMEGK